MFSSTIPDLTSLLTVYGYWAVFACIAIERDVSELRTRESTKRVRHFSPASFWMLGYQHHGRKRFQSVAEHLALLGKGNRLLHSGTDPKELTHFIEGSAET